MFVMIAGHIVRMRLMSLMTGVVALHLKFDQLCITEYLNKGTKLWVSAGVHMQYI